MTRQAATSRPSLARVTLAAGIVALTLSAPALPAYAEALVDASDAPQVPAGQVVDGSAYLAGNTVTVAGTVQGDLYCGANTVTITGVVEGDVLCGANTLNLSGQVGGDVRLGGNAVTLGGSTAGAAAVAGSTVTITPDASIGTDLTVGGAQVDLAGSVGRDVRAGAETATISGTVGRNVDGELANLTVAEGARVAGHLHYVSDTDATIAPGSVAGDIRRTDPPPQEVYRGPGFGTWAVVALLWIVGFVVLSVLVALALPRYVRGTSSRTWSDLGMSLLVGFLTFLAAGPAALLLLVTGIGALAALLLWSALGVAMMVGTVLVAHTVGRAVLSHRERNVVGTTALGAVMLAVVGAVPILGPLVVFLAACAGLGMIVRGLRSQHERRAPVTPTGPYPYPAPAAGTGPGAPPPYVAGPSVPAAPPAREPPADATPTQQLPAQEPGPVPRREE